MSDPTLKACPFCGSPAEYLGSSLVGWAVSCAAGAEFMCDLAPATWTHKTKKAAAERWNTRAAADALPGEGWMLVPRKLTTNMIRAWNATGPTWQDAYNALLAAAPQPEEKK